MSSVGAALAVLAGYLAGSIPTGLLVARARGVDLRRAGSGNIGATNVARTLGRRLGAVVLVADALKGLLPVLAARSLWLDGPRGATLVAGVGLAAVLGHVFPVWLGFRGGKGVATALGVFLAISPLATLAAAAVYAAVFALARISSLGSLAAATTLPVVLLARRAPAAFVTLAVLLWGVIVLRHRGNIRRLLRHEEHRV